MSAAPPGQNAADRRPLSVAPPPLQIAANPPVIADLPPQSAAELPIVADLPAVQTAREEKKVPAAGFVAAPISNESSLNDDFFGNFAPSPTTERAKPPEADLPKQPSVDSDSSTPPRRKAEPPEKPKPKPKGRKESSLDSDPFADINVDIDLQEMEPPPPKKQDKKKPAKKQPPKKESQPSPVKEANSAVTFEFDIDQIKFDFIDDEFKEFRWFTR